MEVNLKEAAVLCRKSEKTLRRKIEAGLLHGRKDPLEFGGFMWMIDLDSLEELYPGSRPSQLPQLYDAPEPPQVRIRSQRESQETAGTDLVSATPRPTQPTEEEEFSNSETPSRFEYNDEDEDDTSDWSIRQSFFDYLLEENRGLKSDLRSRDARILALSERACVLERALGEQEGTAATQSRVLEWFQTQENLREKTRVELEQRLLKGDEPTPALTKTVSPIWSALAGAGVTALLALGAVLLSGLPH